MSGLLVDSFDDGDASVCISCSFRLDSIFDFAVRTLLILLATASSPFILVLNISSSVLLAASAPGVESVVFAVASCSESRNSLIAANRSSSSLEISGYPF